MRNHCVIRCASVTSLFGIFSDSSSSSDSELERTVGKALSKLKKATKTKTLAEIEKHRRRLQKAEEKLRKHKQRKEKKVARLCSINILVLRLLISRFRNARSRSCWLNSEVRRKQLRLERRPRTTNRRVRRAKWTGETSRDVYINYIDSACLVFCAFAVRRTSGLRADRLIFFTGRPSNTAPRPRRSARSTPVEDEERHSSSRTQPTSTTESHVSLVTRVTCGWELRVE